MCRFGGQSSELFHAVSLKCLVNILLSKQQMPSRQQMLRKHHLSSKRQMSSKRSYTKGCRVWNTPQMLRNTFCRLNAFCRVNVQCRANVKCLENAFCLVDVNRVLILGVCRDPCLEVIEQIVVTVAFTQSLEPLDVDKKGR
jgi:hypothetical protein